MNQTKKNNWTNVYMAVIAVVMYVMIPIYYTFIDTDKHIDPRAEKAEINLQSELDMIQPMPGAVFLKKGKIIRYGGGHMYYTYSIDAKYTEVLRYYDLELRSKEWNFDKIRIERNTGFVTGNRFAEYKKGSYTAEIKYREDGEGIIEFSLIVLTPHTY